MMPSPRLALSARLWLGRIQASTSRSYGWCDSGEASKAITPPLASTSGRTTSRDDDQRGGDHQVELQVLPEVGGGQDRLVEMLRRPRLHQGADGDGHAADEADDGNKVERGGRPAAGRHAPDRVQNHHRQERPEID